MITTREDFLNFIESTETLRLNKYDYRFLTTLKKLLKKNNYITTNQNDLFEKLVSKYRKQLRKIKIVDTEILSTEWTVPIVLSDKEHTEAFAYIDNDMLCLKLPFNKKFIDEFYEYHKNYYLIIYSDSILKWNKEEKIYKAKFNTYNFKTILDLVPTFFNLNLCSKLQSLLDEISVYNEGIYDPLYVKIKNNYYILSCNQSLSDATIDLTFDNSPATLYELSRYGVSIDKSVTEDDNFLEFAGSVSCSFDVKDFDVLVYYLLKLDLKNVLVQKTLGGGKIKSALSERMDQYKKILNFVWYPNFPSLLKDNSPRVFLKTNSSVVPYEVRKLKSYSKVITITDSSPVVLHL